MRIENKDNIFFTSDFHLFHHNILRFDNRPFNTVQEMNDKIVENWNNTVKEDDIIFFLGDLTFGDFKDTKYLIDGLNGTIHYILGNHDRFNDIRNYKRFDTIDSLMDIQVRDNDANRGWQSIVLCHYAILEWNKAQHGAFHLHGHSHGGLLESQKEYYKHKVLDMGCNLWDYTPVSYNEIKEIMKSKTIKSHH